METVGDIHPRVFITNYAGHDYKDAERYGELVFITKGYVSFQSLDRVKYQVVEGVCNSRKEDWLVFSGRALISAISAMAWLQLHGICKILHWDEKKSEGKYREIIITKENLDEMFMVLTGTQDQ